MNRIDEAAWAWLQESVRQCPKVRDEIRAVVELSVSELQKLPFVDGSTAKGKGVSCCPYWTESTFDQGYLEFLDGQINRNVRGVDWFERLGQRREALAPFVNVLLRHYTIRWATFDGTVIVILDRALVVLSEFYLSKGGVEDPS